MRQARLQDPVKQRFLIAELGFTLLVGPEKLNVGGKARAVAHQIQQRGFIGGKAGEIFANLVVEAEFAFRLGRKEKANGGEGLGNGSAVPDRVLGYGAHFGSRFAIAAAAEVPFGFDLAFTANQAGGAAGLVFGEGVF